MAVIRSEKFIMVESGNNHNKCWYIEEHDNGLIRTTWGRVGNALSTTDKQFGMNSSKEYDKLVKSKLKKGYTKLRTIDSASSSPASTPPFSLKSLKPYFSYAASARRTTASGVIASS